jgi:hypothetical protein
MGVAGSEIGYVVQERNIRTMQFLPGDINFIFNISRVLSDRGCISKYGFVSVGNNLYFEAEEGFYLVSGQQVTAIGADKVNDWFLAHSDIERRTISQAIKFPNRPRIAWAFYGDLGSVNYDNLIIFDWSNQRWTHAVEFAQVWANTLVSVDLDLDTDGGEPGDVFLDSDAMPLDSFAYVGGRPLVGGINPAGQLAALSGPPLQATIETAEAHAMPGQRTFISDAYPLVDGAAETVAVATRERLQDPVVWQPPQPVEITGSAAIYTSSRLHRFRVRLPAGEKWTHAQGVIADAQQDGTVA